jgi:hypothetical protein
MKKIRLIRLKIVNFKGINELEITDFDSGISIFGDNATGKTTVFDAVNWLLFDKDSLNASVFEIKPLNNKGESVHNLEHTVSATLKTNGGEVDLKKIYREVYTKRRGEAKQSFTGHTNDYSVDGVGCPKKEFTAIVNQICNEENFKLLTNTRYFNEIMHWTDRRRLLLEVCGDVPDDVIIASNEDLAGLPDILGRHTTEQHKKFIADKTAEINKALAKIPTRIDERSKMIKPVSETDGQVDTRILELKDKKTTAEKELADIMAGGGIPEKDRKLAELDGQVLTRQNAMAKEKGDRESTQRQELAELEKAALAAGSASEKAVLSQTNLMEVKKSKLKLVLSLTKKQDALRAKWVAKDDEPYTPIVGENICTACGRALEAEDVAEAARLAELAWNEKRALDLTTIVNEGKGIKTDIDKLEKESAQLLFDIKIADETIKDLAESQALAENAFDDKKAEFELINAKIPTDITLDKLIADADVIRFEINSLRAGNNETVMAAEQELERVEKLIESYQATKQQLADNALCRNRIYELETEEQNLAAKLEGLEGDLFTIESFIRTKVAMLEDKIKAKFRFATFRMFTENINGGLEECCDTTFEGVPYASMNNGARINVGLDICNTLSEHYGMSLPCFIDNSEAVTSMLDSDAQQIRLYVSEADKKLRIEKI